ncbi:MAG: hypothetical protein V1772_01925 [Chloroflexota bacterium]
MPITYTTRRSRTYTLYQGTTKYGKPRYHFGIKSGDTPLEAIPAGYEIHETPNGVVTLRRVQPLLLTESEVALVRKALAARPRPHRFAMDVAKDCIAIYEKVGPDWVDVFKSLGALFPVTPARLTRLDAKDRERANYRPVLKIILGDPQRRTFCVEHAYTGDGSVEWLCNQPPIPLRQAISRYVRALGTPRFENVCWEGHGPREEDANHL